MIYTFYSYKGGVGRSMALANVAQWFYERGLRVLIVDWDLEAPGLEAFFEGDGDDSTALRKPQGGGSSNAKERPGVIDMLVQYKSIHPRLFAPSISPGDTTEKPVAAQASGQDSAKELDPVEVLRRDLPPITGLLYTISLKSDSNSADASRSAERQPQPAGYLLLLPAGLRAGSHFLKYAAAVQSFDWAEFYTLYHGEAYFNWLREQFEAVADVVLIDSRTGVTEMGGVCARQLADVVVSFCAPNEQNLKGTQSMVRSFQRHELKKVRKAEVSVVVVPSRIDLQDSQQFQLFETQFRRATADVPNPFHDLGTSFWELRIPYISKYAYREDLAILDRQGVGKVLGDTYRTLAVHLAALADEDSSVRQKCATHLQAQFPELMPQVVVLYAGKSNEASANWLSNRITKSVSTLGTILDVSRFPTPDIAAAFAFVRHAVVVFSEGAIADDVEVFRSLRRILLYARECQTPLHFVSTDSSDDRPRANLPSWLEQYQSDSAVDGLVDLLKVRSPSPPVPHMASGRPVDFVDREELQKLKVSLSMDSAVAALWGLGGAGKTSLACALADDEEIRAHFDGGVLWASLSGAARLEPHLDAMIAALKGEAAPQTQTLPTDQNAINSRVMELARLSAERRTLLILDDVTVPDQFLPILARCRNWAILITTRDRSILPKIAELIHLGDMTAEEAQVLLTGTAKTSEDDALLKIRKNASWLPLPLFLLRKRYEQLRNTTNTPFDALAQWVESEGPFAADIKDAASSPVAGALDKSKSVAATIGSCILRLPRPTLRYLRWIAEEAKSAEEIRTVATLMNHFALAESEANHIATSLEDHALITVDSQSGELKPHVLVRRYLDRPGKEAGRKSDIDAVRQATDILRGRSRHAEELLNLAIRLRKVDKFGLARRLLSRLVNEVGVGHLANDRQMFLVQQLALCTYKDPDLPVRDRLERALEILMRGANLANSQDPETLGLAGAIHKRLWENDGQRDHLEDALAWYLRGYEADQPTFTSGFGYTAINAAFILDLLADQEEASTPSQINSAAAGPDARRNQARRLREQIVAVLPGLLNESRSWLRKSWWFYATLTEACFGLRRYEDAQFWVAEGRRLCDLPEWELQSCAQQLSTLATLSPHANPQRSDEPSAEARAVLYDLMDGDEAALRRSLVGKIGLALSGGGFRASLFHIGVLARLAELDALRYVEVLSCVSGGSIVGAHYYLELRKLLRERADRDIKRSDYIDIVKRISQDFLQGVQTNIRTSVLAHVPTSCRMIVDAGYSRTERLAELYEQRLFRLVDDKEGDSPRFLNELRITPQGWTGETFEPKTDNWRRACKVPILILNATTLNTGHNWQFTASFMGEPPGAIDTRVDGNRRFRRMYYSEAPEGYKKMRLGRAVAASACVPGLFEPLAFKDLYPDQIVRLVDGGVHDNQGVGALLEQDCSVLLVSDASGQMQEQNDPSQTTLGVSLRANGVLQARIRTAQYQGLDSRQRSKLLRALMFIHLRKDLDVDPVNWTGCNDPVEASDEARPAARRGVLTSYGIRKDVQEKLAAIRTDLDSFSDLEAYALMVSGYRMTESEFPVALQKMLGPPEDLTTVDWCFRPIEDEMCRLSQAEARYKRLMSVLATGNRTFLKLWQIPQNYRRSFAQLGALAFLVAVYWTLTRICEISSGWAVAWTIASAPLLYGVWRFFLANGLLSRGLVYGLGTLPAMFYVVFLDRVYLATGKYVAKTQKGKCE